MKVIAGVAGFLAVVGAFNNDKPASAARAGQIAVYPSSQNIPPNGVIPGEKDSEVVMNTAIGGHDGAWVVIKNAKNISAVISETEVDDSPVVELDYGHFVKFGSKLVPDALVPWDGSSKDTEEPNQPIFVEVETPYGTAPGKYNQSITIEADGTETEVPVTVIVYDAVLPQPNKYSKDNPVASFNVSPQTYVNTTDGLFNHKNNEERQESYNSLYKFLAEYRISPNSWGFGEPRTTAGYSPSRKWWVDSEQNMINAVGEGESIFPALRIPISNNRTSPNNYIANLNPSKPESWCGYLKTVHSFWNKNGWLNGTISYLYGQDEPGLAGQKLVERQAEVVHKCFPESKVLMTGNPSPKGVTDFLMNDVDIWSILASRTYGLEKSATGINRSKQYSEAIKRIRSLGKTAWSYNYNVPGTPGYTTDEPLSNPRMFMLWNALEQNGGTLYTQGMTTYDSANPLKNVGKYGEHVLIYPGQSGPVASARLEQMRYGLEDWALLNIVSKKAGATAMRRVLGSTDLFSVDDNGAQVACRTGCELVGDTKYAWPKWSKDSSTPSKIESARVKALKIASK